MNKWDRECNDNKYKQKLNKIKSALPRVANTPLSSNGFKKKSNNPNQTNYNSNAGYNASNNEGRKSNDFNKQPYLKHLLNEFGLGQYLRKMFEVGYDDNTIDRLGLLSYKDFEELLRTLRIFPGHQIKMNHLYEYLRQINSYTGAKKPRISAQKRYHSHNRISAAIRKMPKTTYTKSTSFEHNNNKHHMLKQNNNIVGSFIKGDFGVNYYLEDTHNFKPIEKAKLDDESHCNGNASLLLKIEDSEKRNEDIERMLNYYMGKLNEKLDNSYDSIDDSSLSNIHCNEIMFNNNDQRNIQNISEIKPMKDKENVTMTNSLINNKSVSTRKDNEANNASNIKVEIKGNNANGNGQGGSKDNSHIRSETTKNSVVPSKESQSITQIHSQPITTKNDKGKNLIIKEVLKENVSVGVGKKEDIIEEVIKKEEIKKQSLYEENATEDIIVEDIKTKSNIKPNTLQQTSHLYQCDSQSQSQSQSISEFQSESQSSPLNHSQNPKPKVEMKTESIQAKPSQSSSLSQINRNIPFSKEETMFDNIRLTKSFEAESLRQNTEQFDIEYMCRCLGLAIMRHLESSKDKQHITELVDMKEMFSFYGSLYNSKIDFIFNFFNQSLGIQPISNLDRLDMEESKAKEALVTVEDKRKPKDISEYNNDNAKQISFVNHVKDKTMSALPEIKQKKLKSGLGDIEKDIKFIDEFFSVGNNKKRTYNNLSEKTKNVLCKELSYINEVDSHDQLSQISNSNHNNSILKCNESLDKSHLSNVLLPQLTFTNQHNNYSNIEDNQLNNTNPLPSSSNKDTNNNNNKFSNILPHTSYNQTPISHKNQTLDEDIPEQTPFESNKEIFESGEMESNYMIDASSVDKLKSYLLKQSEIYDDDYIYQAQRIQTRKYVPLPDPQAIFEFCANIMILTKMEKEVIIITLIYLERFIFNTGLLLTSRNWRRITFTAMIMASKIWDDDSFENNHFAQVFTHLSIGEINFMERVYLELINYKVYVKCSEYFKYFFVIKSIALKYNFNGMNLVPISVERMMKIQEYAYQMQKKIKKKYSLSNSAQF